MNKKRNLSRDIMMHEQWLEDGRKIGKLTLVAKYLARRLAVLGVHPSGGEFPASTEAELARLQDAWLAAGNRAAETAYAKGGRA